MTTRFNWKGRRRVRGPFMPVIKPARRQAKHTREPAILPTAFLSLRALRSEITLCKTLKIETGLMLERERQPLPPRMPGFLSVIGPNRLKAEGQSPLCPLNSDVNLFRYPKRVVDLDTKVADRALDPIACWQ